MSNNIGWCDCTINPVVGCTKCSPGCEHCYAERFAARLAKNPATAKKYAGVVDEGGRWTGKISEPDWSCFEKLPKSPRRVFVGSMTDIFYDPTTAYLKKLFTLMASLPQHTFLLLTKRPERIDFWGIENISANVWFGTTICNQEEADEKVPSLLRLDDVKRFVSIEPMLGPIEIEKWLPGSYECTTCLSRFPHTYSPDLCCYECGFSAPSTFEIWGEGGTDICPKCGADGASGAVEFECPDCGSPLTYEHPDTPYINWVICGGETGNRARPMHPDWVRSLRDQCQIAGVPFYFKGWGGSGKYGPALLDGKVWHQFPK